MPERGGSSKSGGFGANLPAGLPSVCCDRCTNVTDLRDRHAIETYENCALARRESGRR
jgi:hypothetical protein